MLYLAIVRAYLGQRVSHTLNVREKINTPVL